jgi:hypothetical protein
VRFAAVYRRTRSEAIALAGMLQCIDTGILIAQRSLLHFPFSTVRRTVA